MSGRLKRIICMVGMWMVLAMVARGQSHFMYIQSESGTPFYIKMNDSLISSTSSGYLILHKMKKGTYPVVIGFAKQKVPEAAFKLSVGDSGDRGYTLKAVGGKLRLIDIQSQQVMQPIEVATSAGNRILPSTMDEISKAQAADSPATEPEAAGESQVSPAATAPAETASTDQPADPQNNPFENMLNAVTGSGTTQPPAAQPVPAEKSEPQVSDSALAAATPTSPPAESTSSPASEPQDDSNPFTDLLNPDPKTEAPSEAPPVSLTQNEPRQSTEAAPPQAAPPAGSAGDLTFIDFGNSSEKEDNQAAPSATTVAEDTLITTGKELRQWKRQQRRAARDQQEKRSTTLFNDLMSKVDTVATDSAAATSVAYPLLGNNGERNKRNTQPLQPALPQGEADAVVCNEVADADYFAKVLRKTAGKKSQEAMLRTATRYLSSDRCYTTGQIKQWAYQFASDDSRLTFLKAAYLHCADKENYGSLASVLSDTGSQNRLKAFIR